MRTTTAVKKLIEAFPSIDGIHVARKEYGVDAIHLGNVAEGGEVNGLPAADYYNEDYKERFYVFGVHKALVNKLDELGFYAECYDPGTYLAYRK